MHFIVDSKGYFQQVKAGVYKNKRKEKLEVEYSRAKFDYQESKSEFNWDELQNIQRKIDRADHAQGPYPYLESLQPRYRAHQIEGWDGCEEIEIEQGEDQEEDNNEEVIDVHVHIGKDIFAEKNKLRNARGNESEQNYKELLRCMKINKIKKSLIMPFPSPAEFYSQGTWYTQENKDILDITNNEENLYGLLAFHPKDYKEIEKLISIKIKGLKLHTRATSVDPKDLIGRPIMNILKKFSLPLLLHIGTGKEEELINSQKSIELPSAIELAKNEPEVIFIFAHLGRLNKSLFEGLELDNVFFDTSGLSLINKYPESFLANDTISNLPKESSKVLELLIEKGYSNKILFGSDEPYGTSYIDELNIIKKANIPEGEKIKILSLNARRVFNI